MSPSARGPRALGASRSLPILGGALARDASTAPGCELGALPLETWEYRWASCRARADSPNVGELEARGWTVEHVDRRYGTSLCRRQITPRNDGMVRSTAIILLLAALWISVFVWVGVRYWQALVAEARTELIGVER